MMPAFLRRLRAADLPAAVFLVLVGVFVAVYPRIMVVEDLWYHVGIGHWIATHLSIPLDDPISFLPFGRAHVYPPLLHVLFAAVERIVGDPIAAMRVLQTSLLLATLGATYLLARRVSTPLLAFVALVLAATDDALVISAWSLMPAMLAAVWIMAAILAALDRRPWRAGIFLALACATHFTFGPLGLLGIAAAAAVSRTWRPLWKSVGLGLVGLVPFAIVLVERSGAFAWEQFAVRQSDEGFGAFAYASHYSVQLLTLAAVLLGISMLLPLRTWATRILLAAAPSVSLALVAGSGGSGWIALLGGILGLVSALAILFFLLRHLVRLRSDLRPEAQEIALLLSVAIVGGVILPVYGGRYLWHYLPVLLALAASGATLLHAPVRISSLAASALSTVNARIDELVGRPSFLTALPVQKALLGVALVAAALSPVPHVQHTRGTESHLILAKSAIIAGASKERELFEEQVFLEVVRWIDQYAPPGAIIHTNHALTGYMLSVFTDRGTDNGMLWETAPKALLKRIQAERERGVGLYVYFEDPLPASLAGTKLRYDFGSWEAAYAPPTSR